MPDPESTSNREATQQEIDYLAGLLQKRFSFPPKYDADTPSVYIHPVSNNLTPEQIDSGEHAPTIGKLDDGGPEHLVAPSGDPMVLRAVRGVVLPERGSLSDTKLLRYTILYPGSDTSAHLIGADGTIVPPRSDRRFLVDIYDDGRPSEAWSGLSSHDHKRATSQDIADLYGDIELAREVPQAA